MESVVLRCLVGALLIASNDGSGLRKKPPEVEMTDFVLGGDQSDEIRMGSSLVDLGLSRIVGGYEADVGEYPFFAEWGQSFCGGALVTEDVVLTAAHCEEFIGVNTMYIGGVESTADIATGNPLGGVRATIEQRAIHPLYDRATLKYDLTLLKLTKKVTDRAPLSINSDDDYPSPGQDLIVMGYGRETEGSSFLPDRLNEVTVQKTSDEKCTDQYGPLPFDVMFCAGVEGGGKDSCQGDSGGPIITRDPFGTMKLVGVVSWGYGCARAEAHGVYARVSAVHNWIKDTACGTLESADDAFCGRPTPSTTDIPTASPVLSDTDAPTTSVQDTPSPSSSSSPSAPTMSLAPSTTYTPTTGSLSPANPTANCDDLEGTFTVDGGVGDKDCEWLKTDGNPRYKFLCNFISVASICRGFCDACHYFEE
uniref:Peptidase S1 domain-containing protein n=1 Tax=Grammatophora oceanica TaxID=210454 RepID=A0A7S1YK16_9STRA|mmetsp:Transcript_50885/g.76083  ORF Transcript_50885/g.76083 Transcript_50885/m.76083 type:complete len:422 (+) Transcript_50885:50-1315(+)